MNLIPSFNLRFIVSIFFAIVFLFPLVFYIKSYLPFLFPSPNSPRLAFLFKIVMTTIGLLVAAGLYLFLTFLCNIFTVSGA